MPTLHRGFLWQADSNRQTLSPNRCGCREARCEQAENAIHDFGFLAKHPTTSQPIESPFVKISGRYQKQAQGQWSQIEVNIAERLRYFVDKNAASTDPLDIILNRAVDKAGR